MSTVIYGSKRDYRNDMQNPFSPSRSHAICRKLTATAKQDSKWYGAHYWAACAATSHDEWLGDSLIRHRDRWLYEAMNGAKRMSRETAMKVWDIAIRRVMNLRKAALELKTSMAW